jgi:hypothetical protein
MIGLEMDGFDQLVREDDACWSSQSSSQAEREALFEVFVFRVVITVICTVTMTTFLEPPQSAVVMIAAVLLLCSQIPLHGKAKQDNFHVDYAVAVCCLKRRRGRSTLTTIME